ncbi:MAG: hypothetical protein ACUVWJ_08630 [Spirochaetota bacterium]
MMRKFSQWLLTVLLILFLVLTFYAIFNAGSERSFFRLFINDTSYDVTITLALGAVAAALAVALYAGRTETPLKQVLDMNVEYINELRQEGRSDEYIADSFLKEAGSKKGIFHNIAKRKILRYLSRL